MASVMHSHTLTDDGPLNRRSFGFHVLCERLARRIRRGLSTMSDAICKDDMDNFSHMTGGLISM